MRNNDTIAAIATAMSPSGIGIIRISGEEAISIADRIFKGKNKIADVQSHTINYGYICDGNEQIDQVLLMLMKAPHSYTGEDVVEIQCHGGIIVMKKILTLVLDAGAYPAEPGEFTKRAFLNGKIDLSQAEAVADIIDAENNNALKVGMKQLRGELSCEIKDIRQDILQEIAYIEAALDDPEHYSLEGYGDHLIKVLIAARKRIEKLITSFDTGVILKSGINTVILGKPNAGKSSLYNLLAGEEKAIVTDIAGTTRDTLTENINFGDIKLNITDTAGLRDSEDKVEKIGVLRAKSAASEADLLLCVIEIGSEIAPEDLEILDFTKGKRRIIILNKSDIFSGNFNQICKKIQNIVGDDTRVILFSAKTGLGKSELEAAVNEMFLGGSIDINNEIYVTSIRHLNSLKGTMSSIDLVIEAIRSGISEDLISVDLTDAYDKLGQILGETIGEDIINEIFSKFCMGK